MHDIIIGQHGGLYLTGFDSRRRVCLVLFAPPFGQPLRTVTELVYRDYGRYTPTVIGAHDPDRDASLYVLLYQHPDNLGLEQMSLYRVDTITGEQLLLTATSSPYWPPTGLVPHPGGSLLVSLSGQGPLLLYSGCNDTACSAPLEISSEASRAYGKGGMVSFRGMLCLVVGSNPIYRSRGRVACEGADGSLARLTARRPDAGRRQRRRASSGGEDDDERGGGDGGDDGDDGDDGGDDDGDGGGDDDDDDETD